MIEFYDDGCITNKMISYLLGKKLSELKVSGIIEGNQFAGITSLSFSWAYGVQYHPTPEE